MSVTDLVITKCQSVIEKYDSNPGKPIKIHIENTFLYFFMYMKKYIFGFLCILY